ncbi:MAG: hypothetical protein K5745_02585 [Saccharofermentans sp.]|nr:hypothetical protein [Saccharofermentans sp.]
MPIYIDNVSLYIDPATGRMLFSVLLGVFITAGFFFRMLLIKVKGLAGGKSAAKDEGYNKYLLDDSAWLKDEPWKIKVLPTIGCEITDEVLEDLKGKIDETITSDRYEQGIKEATEYAWKNKGHSAEAIVDYMTQQEAL